MTHAESHARRLRIANRVKVGEKINIIIASEGVTEKYIYECCRMHGVPWESHIKDSPPKTFEILAALMNTDDSYAKIADRFGITKQRVGQIYRKAVDAGISIPVRL